MKRSYVLSMVCVCLVLALGGVTAGAQKPGDGIKVHGHWTIDVRNPDGALASHNEFENALEPGGASALSGLLGRNSTVNGWRIDLIGANSGGPCVKNGWPATAVRPRQQ